LRHRGNAPEHGRHDEHHQGPLHRRGVAQVDLHLTRLSEGRAPAGLSKLASRHPVCTPGCRSDLTRNVTLGTDRRAEPEPSPRSGRKDNSPR
jgi:hypothetical protein